MGPYDPARTNHAMTSPPPLTGQTAQVTGASRGIGRAVALALSLIHI